MNKANWSYPLNTGCVGGVEGGGCQPVAPWGHRRRKRNGYPTPEAVVFMVV